MESLHGKIGILALLALSWLHALGWSSSSPQALASRPSVGFCQISNADDLLQRVGEPTPANTVKLVVSEREVERGVLVRARLMNTTPHLALFGSEFKIQRYGDQGWSTDPSSPDGPWPLRMGKLLPNRAAGCYRFSVPEGQDPGRYRFKVNVDLGAAKKGRVAEFLVRGTK